VPIAAANRTRYGLAAYVFTNDLNAAMRTAPATEAGVGWGNEVSRPVLGAALARLPTGDNLAAQAA